MTGGSLSEAAIRFFLKPGNPPTLGQSQTGQEALMSSPVACLQCGRKLHNAIFCNVCKSSFCTWRCYLQHAEQHARPAAVVADAQVEVSTPAFAASHQTA